MHLKNPGGLTKSNKLNAPKSKHNYQDFIDTKERDRSNIKLEVESKEEELKNIDKKLNNSLSKNQAIESEL